jgi:hypothetical protein
MYGFSMWNCRAFHNHAEGFKFVSCVLWPSTLTAMWNRGSGVYATGTHLNGLFHVEGNESWGLDFDAVTGDLNVWQEGNRYFSPNYIYVWINSRLRNCASGLTLRGQTQDNFGIGFDLDDVSRTGTLIKRAEVDPERLATLEPYDLGLPAMGDNAVFDNTQWQTGYRPTIVRAGETLHLDVVAGTYNHQVNGNNTFISLFPSINGVSFSENDWLEFVFTVELDAAAGAYFYGERDNNVAVIGISAGAPFNTSTTLFMPLKSGGKKTFCFRAQATTTATATYLFWIVTNRTGASGNAPPAAHRVSVTNVRLCKIPG